MRFLLGAFGDAGHAFPVIALGRALVARGHDVWMETWDRWHDAVEGEGMHFARAPEYQVFPTSEKPLKPYQAVVQAARAALPLVEEVRPDAVVADILTLAPGLAGEMYGAPVATVIPHVWPVSDPELPPFSFGARRPRTVAGRALWRSLHGLVARGEEQGRRELNETRRRLGLRPLDRVHGGISDRLALVGTFPQFEYPRAWPPWTRVVGPLLWEQPFGEVELPPGDAPLVLVAPSTIHDPEARLLRAALEGLAGEPVRVLASWNRRPAPAGIRVDVPDNARLVEWVSYGRTMPEAAVVISHAGHGTVARAVASGCAVVCCPVAGDQNENAARAVWAGTGVRLPRRWVAPRPLRLAVRRALAGGAMRARAEELQSWVEEHDPAARAAELVEELASGG